MRLAKPSPVVLLPVALAVMPFMLLVGALAVTPFYAASGYATTTLPVASRRSPAHRRRRRSSVHHGGQVRRRIRVPRAAAPPHRLRRGPRRGSPCRPEEGAERRPTAAGRVQRRAGPRWPLLAAEEVAAIDVHRRFCLRARDEEHRARRAGPRHSAVRSAELRVRIQRRKVDLRLRRGWTLCPQMINVL